MGKYFIEITDQAKKQLAFIQTSGDKASTKKTSENFY